MKNSITRNAVRLLLGVIMSLLVLGAGPLEATITGQTGTTFNFTAKAGYISMTDGNSIYMWGYGVNSTFQYPGPTLILNQGDTVTITLSNSLPVNTSIVFPGQTDVTAAGGVPGLLTTEAVPGGTVTYTFTASQPGTYTYYSGTKPELQVEMGLIGAIIVRPNGAIPVGFTGRAYGHDDTAFNREFLFLLSEIDPTIHSAVQLGKMDQVDTSKRRAVYWTITGRDGPDTTAASGYPALPAQPYGSLAMFHPGERVLMRIINGGRDPHPFHAHGNQHNQIARDARMLQSAPGQGPDMQESVFTSGMNPGQTVDAIFTWTGAGLGWDVYGHAPGDPLQPNEDPAYHGVPVPVTIPSVEVYLPGQFFSGSPYLGGTGPLLPGEGGFNPLGGYFYMWHSHSEKELTTNNIFPGGMLTFAVVVPWNDAAGNPIVIEPGNP